ncbi:hypothetical protein GCM10010294_32250 [Streptomyces griseoloalbus]|uniref:helix-turn-helix domain-containing protein n=1 Tax=Streptomyces griseoloalbus TaxID=67303 RepID=UPI001875E561|nr:hypothetical protein GCM10010294_32250 [Streptomyces griseoloalbus]
MGCLGYRPKARVGTYECGVTVSAQDDVADVAAFAALLRELKERTDRSYGSLARRLNMNTSTLHRYCAGEAVPVDFAPVERFAALCGASSAERLELHRRWLRAVQARRRPRGVDGPTGAVAESATDPDPGSGRASDSDSDSDSGSDSGSGSGIGIGIGSDSGSGSDSGAGFGSGSGSGSDSGSGEQRAASRERTNNPAPGTPAVEPARGALLVGGAPDAPSGPVAASGGEDGPTTGRGTAEGAGESGPPSAPGVQGDVVSGPWTQEARVRRPWYRRRKRIAVALAAACALLATVGSLSALPDGRRSSGEREPSSAPPSASATTGPAAPRSPTSPPAPSGSASGSGSASASAKPKGRGPTSPAPRHSFAAPAAPGESAPAGSPPLTWSADSQVWAHGCGHDYVIAKPPKQVPPPPAPQDAGTWAATQSAVHGGETMVELSVQGTSDTAVVLTALRVRVAGRTDPAPGNAYAMDQGCGGALTPRYFDVDLDKDRPIARAVAGNDAGTPIPAVRMPYRVSATDPEVLLVTARTAGCDCRWYLELDWSSQGRTGTVRVDDHGRPFRTSGIEGLPRYAYDTSARDWAPRVR